MADIPGGDIGSFIVDRDQVERALRRLDPDWRAVVVVHFFLGLPLPETAEVLGIPLGTVKSRLHRSLAAMRTDLQIESGSGSRRASARADGMSAFDRSDRFQQELPELLTAIAAPRVPDYVDDLMASVAATRQRPRWTFPERWLPMGVTARRPVFFPPVPLRSIIVVALHPCPRGSRALDRRVRSSGCPRHSVSPGTGRSSTAAKATSTFAIPSTAPRASSSPAPNGRFRGDLHPRRLALALPASGRRVAGLAR